MPLDGVRCIVNRFSGRLGIRIAEELGLRGAEVQLILGAGSAPAPEWLPCSIAHSYEEYRQLVLEQVAVGQRIGIFSAAVADYRPGRDAHVINLTLLPLTPDDLALLDRALPAGSVAILSRGFGNCRVSSTGIRHLWRVQYFNNMQTLILNTLEITRVPDVALAADEDLADSHERLVELIDWMGESATA